MSHLGSSSGNSPGDHDLSLLGTCKYLIANKCFMNSTELTFRQTGAMAGLNFGVDSGLWKLMAQNGDMPQKVDELAEKLAIDHVLLSMFHVSSCYQTS